MNLRAIYTWLASGIFFGLILTIGVLAFIPVSEADLMCYLGLVSGILLIIASIFSFLGIEIRKLILKDNFNDQALNQSLRQGLEIAVLIIASGILWKLTGLNWWELSLMIAAVIFAELAFAFSKNKQLGGANG